MLGIPEAGTLTGALLGVSGTLLRVMLIELLEQGLSLVTFHLRRVKDVFHIRATRWSGTDIRALCLQQCQPSKNT